MKLTTLLIGLNDKDTKEQIIETAEALDLVTGVFAWYCDGATISNALGVYTHIDGTLIQENSIRIEILNGNDDAIMNAVLECKRVLNQETIMRTDVETNAQFI